MPSERDWKHLRRLHPTALDRFCNRILEECGSVLSEHDTTAHQRYLKLFRMLRTRDAELAAAFDDMRRSRAIDRLITMRRLELLTDEEMDGFSEGTQKTVAALLDL